MTTTTRPTKALATKQDKGDFWTVREAEAHGVIVRRSNSPSTWPLEVDNRSGCTIWFLQERPAPGQQFRIYTRLPRTVQGLDYCRLEPGEAMAGTW
jgi:hypothetical protein